MFVQLRLPLILLFFLLFAHLVSPTANAQNAASVAAEDLATERAESEGQKKEEGLWDGILSSIVDFFVDESPDSDTDESQDLQGNEGKENADQQNAEADATTQDAQKSPPAIGGTRVASNQMHRRRNLRHGHVDDNDVTASHVYQATVNLISEIVILRNAMNIIGRPEKLGFRQHQTSIHAYAKSLELMQKTARIQKRLGMIPVEVGHIPVKTLALVDVYGVVQAIIEELRRIKRQLIVKDDIEFAPFVGGRTPSHVYENLLHASLLLDGLVGRSTTPNDVYVQVLRVHEELNLVATQLDVSLDVEPPPVEHGKQLMAVAQQLLRAGYKLMDLQTRLGMDASNVPNVTLENATSADVLDATSFLLAEIARIKAHLNIQFTVTQLHDAENMTTTDVFARLLLVIKNLEKIGEAAERAG